MLVKVKWGTETYSVDLDTSQPSDLFKAQLFALTNVPIERQKIVIAGKRLGDTWDGVKVRAGMTMMLMGSADPLPEEPTKQTKFLEDMTPEELGQMNVKIPSGLENLGNTCYLNSVVQVLHHIPRLNDTVKTFKKGSDPHAQLTTHLGQVFHQMAISGGVPYSPLLFLSQVYKVFPDFAERKEDSMVPMQQDAEECFSRILNVLDSQLEGNQIRRLFALEMESEYRCVEGDDVSKMTEMTFKLPCPIKKDTTFLMSGIAQSLEDSVTKYSEVLGRETIFMKKQRILRLPKFLVVQMNRFYWKAGVGNKPGNRAKIVKPIQYPEVLDVFDLCDDTLKAKLKSVRMAMESAEEQKLGLAKEKQDNSGTANEITQPPLPDFAVEDNQTGKYRLFAIITHEGYSAEGGHYTAWVHSVEDEKADWFWFDDAKVTIQTAETVKALARSTGDAPIPYLMFYVSVKSGLEGQKSESADVVMKDAQ
jgi:ubiquitin carboxyl-terminal hydrolase 14